MAGCALTLGSSPFGDILSRCFLACLDLLLHVGLEAGLHLRVASGPIHLLLCCAFLCQRVSSLVARHVAVGGNPLQGDCMASTKGGKSSRQVIVFIVPV